MERNLRLLLAIKALMMSLFPVAIITLFWKYELGMSMQDILVLQAAFSITIAVLEFPAGHLGDRMGYRLSLITGLTIATAGWTVYVFADRFALVLLAEIIMATGLVFVSGSDQALMYESLAALDNREAYTRWSGRWVAVGQLGEGLAALSAGLLYAYWTRLPFVLEVLAFVIALGLALLLRETPRDAAPRGTHLGEMKEVFSISLKRRPLLRWTLLLSCCFGLSTYFPVWIVQLYAREAGVTLAWLGVVWGVANLCVAAGATLSSRLESGFGIVPTLVLCLLLMGAGYAGLSLSHAIWGVCFYFLLTLMRGINQPILLSRVQSLIPSRHRAAVLSMRSLLIRGSFAITAPFLGAFVDDRGNHDAFQLLGWVFCLLTMVLMLLALRQRVSGNPLPGAGADR